MPESTPLYGGNADFLDTLYEQYLRDPASVEARWRTYFESLAPPVPGERSHGSVQAAIAARARQPRLLAGGAPAGSGSRPGGAASSKQAAVSRLVQIWTNRGHLLAHLDPLGLMQRPRPHVLDLEYFGLSPADLETEFFTGSRTESVSKRMKLRDILA